MTNHKQETFAAGRKQMRQRFAYADPRTSGLYKIGAGIMDFLEENLETNSKYADEFFATILPAAIGEAAAKGLTIAALTGAGVPAPMAGAMLGAMDESSKLFREALEEGKPIDEAYREFGFGALMGLTEGLPLAELLGRADKASGGTISELLQEAATKGTEAAVIEAIKKAEKYIRNAEGFDLEEIEAAFTAKALVQFTLSLFPGK